MAADILIRGMEEPPSCSACRMLDGDTDYGFCHAANKWFDDEWFRWYQYPDGDIATDKPLNCPLVPIPAGHGRIVDAAEILEKANNSPWFDGDVAELGLLLGSEVTTIAPAEGGTDDGQTDVQR